MLKAFCTFHIEKYVICNEIMAFKYGCRSKKGELEGVVASLSKLQEQHSHWR